MKSRPEGEAAWMQPSAEDRRNRILLAALELFCERGFHGTAVPLIAQRAGVSVGLIYRHWTSKEELVNHLYCHWKSELLHFVEPKVRAEEGFRAQFRRFWTASYEFARLHPLAFSFLEVHHHHEYLDAQSRLISEQGRGAVLDFFRMGLEQEIVRQWFTVRPIFVSIMVGESTPKIWRSSTLRQA